MLKGNQFPEKHFILSILVLSLTLQTVGSEESIAKTDPSIAQITKNLSSTPLTFTANNGQWSDKVQFRANAGGATMWFSSDGAYYQFTRTIESSASKTSSSYPDFTLTGIKGIPQPDPIETMMIKATFVGANPNPQMIGIDMMEYKCNYFIGNDPNEWQTDVPNFRAVLYEQVYDGIDLKYYGNGQQMEYDFIVSPGADYLQIKIQYEGAESISINDNGELVIETKWGEVIEQRPVIYQIENDSRIAITGKYKMMGDNSFGFELSSSYDPALPLVIDPVLIYSTYLGGTDTEFGLDIAVNDSGNALITGYTLSTNFPIVGAIQTFQASYDAFVTKLSSSGSALVYSTYLGGSNNDFGGQITLDGSGNAYIIGNTDSPNFPTVGEYQTHQGGNDIFVTKINPSGNALVYSTYLGGSAIDAGSGITVDGSGNVYTTGYTRSTNFPTQNPYQSTFLGQSDVFVTKFAPSGDSLVYSTYLGGSNHEFGNGIALDTSGNAYICGSTYSTDFPTVGPYQTDQDTVDVFVFKLNSSGDDLVYSTYLGGGDIENGFNISVDESGNAYINGHTFSTNFPTKNPYQTDQGDRDGFVTKLSPSGDSLVYSTYLGGSGEDRCSGLAVDIYGSAYVIGFTRSTDFPLANAYQGFRNGLTDAYLVKLSPSGNSLVYSSYFGGGSDESGTAVAVDDNGNAYITGATKSFNFPTVNPYQASYAGGSNRYDAFVSKFFAPTSCCTGSRGDLNGDGDDANILDLTFAVDRIFRGGAAAVCPEEADVNADGTPHNILDLTFLVDRIFRGGPAPGPC